MGEFDFPDVDAQLDGIKRAGGAEFFDRKVTGKNANPTSAFQKQHIDPQEDMSGAGRAFTDRISSADVDPDFRFNGGDFTLNGAFQPASQADSVRLGVARHSGRHPRYTEVVASYRRLVEGQGLLVEDPRYLGSRDKVCNALTLLCFLQRAVRHRCSTGYGETLVAQGHCK